MIEAVVECTKGTKEKYETVDTPDGSMLLIDRVLDRRWIANYGFIPDTKQADGQELDTYILGEVQHGERLFVMPICIIYTLDGGIADNKLICVAPTATAYGIRRTVDRIARFICRYKADSLVTRISYKDIDIRYELAKTKAYKQLF